jgi:hypothetical protein
LVDREQDRVVRGPGRRSVGKAQDRVVRERNLRVEEEQDRVVRERNLKVEGKQAEVDLERAEQRQARPEVAPVALCFEPKHWLLVVPAKA